MSEQTDAECTREYQAVVKLEHVEVDSGEKDEELYYKQRCQILRFSPDTKEWKQRGNGDACLMKHKETGKVRIVMREDKTLKLRMNHRIAPETELTANAGSDRSWTWSATDFADDEPALYTFAIRLKTSEGADEFKNKWNEARELNKGGAAAAAVEEKAKSNSNPWVEVIEKQNFDAIKKETVDALWATYDKDGSGFIEAGELKNLMAGLLEAVCKQLKEEGADVQAKIEAALPELTAEMLKGLDKNGDGKVSRDEFNGLNEVRLVA